LTVKVIIDKISKRSKGYAFIEYTTEEAASAALKEMNGKVDPYVSLLHRSASLKKLIRVYNS
jgi:RNA recognition motif-containing protein